MAEAHFQVGDIVRLRSGGPDMTVLGIRTDRKMVSYARTAWFEDGKQKRGSFPFDALEEQYELMHFT